MVEGTTEGAQLDAGSRRICKALAKSWQQIRMAQVLWGPERGAFPFGRGVKRPDANFAGEVSATREGAKDKSTPPPNNSNLFPPSALLPFSHQPSTQHKHRQYAYLQGATLFRSTRLLQRELPAFLLLELESPRLLADQPLLGPLNPELTRPPGCYHRRRDDLGLLRPQAR